MYKEAQFESPNIYIKPCYNMKIPATNHGLKLFLCKNLTKWLKSKVAQSANSFLATLSLQKITFGFQK